MSYDTLKAAVADVVKTNGNKEITGALLQQVLFTMINSLGAGYQYMGVAGPSTNPGTPDQNVFYLAFETGTYTNFGGIQLSTAECAVLEWNGQWTKRTMPISKIANIDYIMRNFGLLANAEIFSVQFEQPYSAGDNYAVYITGFNLVSDYLRAETLASLGLPIVTSPGGVDSVKIPNYQSLCYDWVAQEFVVQPSAASMIGKTILFVNFVGHGRRAFLDLRAFQIIDSWIKNGLTDADAQKLVGVARSPETELGLVNKVDAVRTVNIFNKDDNRIITGYYISGGLNAAAGYQITGPIPVSAGVQYKCPQYSGLGQNANLMICDENGNAIRYQNGIISDGYLLFTIYDGGFVRLNMGVGQANTFMVCKRSEYPSEYVPYNTAVGPEYGLGERQIFQVNQMIAGLVEIQDYFLHNVSVNLFNKFDPLIKNGYYSGGAFVADNSYRVTGPIAVRGGIQYKARHSGAVGATNNTIPIVDATNTKIGQIAGVINGGFITFTPSYDMLISINVGQRVELDVMMVCVAADYPAQYVPYYDYVQLSNVYVPGEMASKLLGKSVIFTGDSICAGAADSAGNSGWASRIGKKNQMNWINRAVSGGTIIDKNLVGSSFTISDTDFGTGADYIILEGGTNDADRIGSILGGNVPALFGSYDEMDYLTQFNNQTFCSAVEKLLQTVISSFPSARVGFIIAPKMGVTSSGYTPTTNNRRAYFETIIKICKKWGVPVLNLWDECTMNPRIASHYSGTAPDPDGLFADGQHPTPKGYELLTPIVESWMETL